MLLVLLACTDERGKETLAKVKGQYAALVQAGTPPRSRDYDALLKDLESIPPASNVRKEADVLIRAITHARGPALERPLAVAGRPDVNAELAEARAECERIAKELPGLGGEARKAKLEVLDACRRRADELSESLAHGPDPADAGH
ncbi:MAG: hypothetical protein JNK82_43235 [Myxococcaceae bacterium]|nr:hypothetical protein [Myxococcaceae bacterium]